MQIGDALERLQCIPSMEKGQNAKDSRVQGLKITGNIFVDRPIRIRQVSYMILQLLAYEVFLQSEVLSLSAGDEETFASDLPELKNRQK